MDVIREDCKPVTIADVSDGQVFGMSGCLADDVWMRIPFKHNNKQTSSKVIDLKLICLNTGKIHEHSIDSKVTILNASIIIR